VALAPFLIFFSFSVMFLVSCNIAESPVKKIVKSIETNIV
jgi:hypothetical protein